MEVSGYVQAIWQIINFVNAKFKDLKSTYVIVKCFIAIFLIGTKKTLFSDEC